jgi:hypothetical protein
MMKVQFSSKGHSAMAKGQKRSTKEIRKPKQVKVSPKTEATLGSQVKLAANANSQRGKGKN